MLEDIALKEEIADCCKTLKLGRSISEMAIDLDANTHQEYLIKLLQSEIRHRETARRNKLPNTAGFYNPKTIDNFNFDEVTLPEAVTPESLHNCDFIKSKTNIVMYGNVAPEKHIFLSRLVLKPANEIFRRVFSAQMLLSISCRKKLGENRKIYTRCSKLQVIPNAMLAE